MKTFNGKILFLDRSDINTDEIIPAKYLTEITKEALKPHLLEDLRTEGFSGPRDIEGKGAILARANFGCGSSREHAPWALEMNGINLVVAESFARIFRRNMYNCGMLAIELPGETIDHIFRLCKEKDVEIVTDIKNFKFIIKLKDEEERIQFSISDFDRALVESGGWVEYADGKY